MQERLSGAARLSLEDARAIQRDLVSVSARDLAVELERRALLPASLSGFRGDYAADSSLALRFEAFLVGFAEPAFGRAGRGWMFEQLRESGSLKAVLLELLGELDAEELRACAVAGAAALEAAELGADQWGDRHRFALAHPFRNIPFLGRRYPQWNFPAPGSFETLQKTAHPHTIERHTSSFGSQSRHVSDLSDLDANFFALLGGQDGWLASENFSDQVALWRGGESIRMPLRDATLRAEFPHTLVLGR